MSKILIDVTRLINRQKSGRLPTGVDRVCLAYLGHFQSRACAVVRYGGKHILFSEENSRQIFDYLLNPQSSTQEKFTLSSVLWSHRILAQMNGKFDCKNAFLFNVGHSGLENPSYAKELKSLNVKPIFMIHDLIPLSYPEYCRPGESSRHVMRMNNVFSSGAGVIGNSHHTLNEMLAFAKKGKLETPPMLAAPIAPALLPAPSSQRLIAGPYFVMIGTIEPRKNYVTMLRIWRRLVEKLGEKAPTLVIIGQRGWECENIVDMLERCEQVRSHVIELSSCSDIELATYLKYAQALLFPSFAEGYGMPMLEALALGTPVIASDLDVFHENVGNIPDYLDPIDTLSWMSQVINYTDSAFAGRVAQIERMKDFVAPTWQQHFQLVEKFLEKLK